VSETPEEAERSILRYIGTYHSSPEEEAALRCAYGDAARLLDALATATVDASRSRGRPTKHGLEMGAMLNHAANRVFALRDKVGQTAPNAPERRSCDVTDGGTAK
jgi:hypothetical protein